MASHKRTRILTQTAAYDHCNFTVLDGAPAGLVEKFVELLYAMDYEDPEVRPLLRLEGMKKWQPGRTDHYALLESSLERFGTIDNFVARLSAEGR